MDEEHFYFCGTAFSTHQARELAELEVRDVEFKNFLDMTLSKLLELHGSCVKCCLDGVQILLISVCHEY